MIIGEHLKGGDLVVNPTKNKQLTNMRASGADEAIRLTPIRKMTLEDCLDYIAGHEYAEAHRFRSASARNTSRKTTGRRIPNPRNLKPPDSEVFLSIRNRGR